MFFEWELVGDEDEYWGLYVIFEKVEDELCGIELVVGLDKGDCYGGKFLKEYEDCDSFFCILMFCEDCGWDL